MTEVPQAESQAEPQAAPQIERQPAETVATEVAAEKLAPVAKGHRGIKPQQAQPVNHVLEKLFELYPKLFGAHFLPLKLGVFHDLMARHPNDFKKDELKLAMGKHARSTRYLECVAASLARHDLDGNTIEPVSPEHVHHAILEVFRRRQARSKDDLRPRLCVLLKQAIENSGLGLDNYAALVRGQDETSNGLLDEAMAQLKAEAAKREALMVTFTASGKTEAEFADMYGMDLKLVSTVLARVRHELAVKSGV